MNWNARQRVITYDPDSHTSIAHMHGYTAEQEDILNKYEYNPLLQKFTVDQINNVNDSKDAEAWVRALDFKTIVEPLVIKPIVNPFAIEPPAITPAVLALLKRWASVKVSERDSMRDKVGVSIWTIVRDSVWNSVGNSVWAIVWNGMVEKRVQERESVGLAYVWDSLSDNVRDNVWDSVRYSVRAYFSSFFDVIYRYDFFSVIALWEMGMVPTYDGEVWRLHGGTDAKVLWEGKVC
jgi:hypothetical protein